MGSAFSYTTAALLSAHQVGTRVAQQGATLITGATTGVPYAAALGAKDAGGLVVGISPASDATEHVGRYAKPLGALDAIVYTGMGYNGREPINIGSCDGIVYIAGEFGTLAEFCMGCYTGKPLAVLTGVGGISDNLQEIASRMQTDHGSRIIYDTDPTVLLDRLMELVDAACAERHPHSGGDKEPGSDVLATLAELRNSQIEG